MVKDISQINGNTSANGYLFPGFVELDKRTWHAKYLHDKYNKLFKQLGHRPNWVERTLLVQCCWLELRLVMFSKIRDHLTATQASEDLQVRVLLNETLTYLGLYQSGNGTPHPHDTINHTTDSTPHV
jgi:hypothetical protein